MNSAADGGWFVGSVMNGPSRIPVRWHDGKVEVLGPGLGRHALLKDVNASGVAVGYVGQVRDYQPLVYRDGRFEVLPNPPDLSHSVALSINNRGDILGMTGDDVLDKIVVWPASQPGTVQVVELGPEYGYQYPHQIDEQGRVLISAVRWEGEHSDLRGLVRSPDGSVVRLAPASVGDDVAPFAIRNGRVVGRSDGTPVEWNLAGQIVRGFDHSPSFLSVDAGNAAAGEYTDGQNRPALGIWRDGVLQLTLGSSVTGYGLSPKSLTNDGVLAANIVASDDSYRRAQQFRRTCP